MAQPIDRGAGAAPDEATVRTLAFGAFVLVAALLAAAAVLSVPYVGARTASARLDFLRAANARLARGNAELAAELDALQNDPFYAERVIRVDLRHRRRGEQVVRVDGRTDRPAPDDLPLLVVDHGAWWQRAAARLAASHRLRLLILLAAATLFLVALLCFGEPRRCAARVSRGAGRWR